MVIASVFLDILECEVLQRQKNRHIVRCMYRLLIELYTSMALMYCILYTSTKYFKLGHLSNGNGEKTPENLELVLCGRIYGAEERNKLVVWVGGGCRADARKTDARFHKEFWLKGRFLEKKTALNIEMHAPYRAKAFFFCVCAYGCIELPRG